MGGGLIWRARDNRNYYLTRANPLEQNIRIYRVVKGVRTFFKTSIIRLRFDSGIPSESSRNDARFKSSSMTSRCFTSVIRSSQSAGSDSGPNLMLSLILMILNFRLSAERSSIPTRTYAWAQPCCRTVRPVPWYRAKGADEPGSFSPRPNDGSPRYRNKRQYENTSHTG